MVKCGTPAQELAPLPSTPATVDIHYMEMSIASVFQLGNGTALHQLANVSL